MNSKALIPLVYLLAGLLCAIVGVSLFRNDGLGEYATLTIILGTGLVGTAGGVVTRHRWRQEEDRDGP